MTIEKLSPKELLERLQKGEKTIILDVRAEDKYNEYHIEAPFIESSNVPKTVIFAMDQQGEGKQLRLPKDREIIVTCTTGNSAAKCADILNRQHYNVKVLEGGVTAWKEYLKSQDD